MTKGKNNRLFTWMGILGAAGMLIFLLFFLPGLLIPPLQQRVIPSDQPESGFTLEPGDILVRPNWNWLPGTFRVEGGRNFGHLAIVTEGARGGSVQEVLQKARVIEALLFDQKTRRFIFGSPEIVRRTSAATSFGERFRGKRYLLRMPMTSQEKKSLSAFLNAQLNDDRYTVFTFKQDFSKTPGTREAYLSADHDRWNCATLAWYAFRYATGMDIDGNGVRMVYPNDIIRGKCFDPPAIRVRF